MATTAASARTNGGGVQWHAKSASTLLGIAGGVTINKLSDIGGWRIAATMAALGGMAAAIAWLKRLPPRTPVARYAPPILLTLAVVAIAVAFADPDRPATSYANLAAVVLTLSAISLTGRSDETLYILLGTSLVAGGVALVAGGVSVLADHTDEWHGLALLGGGLSLLAGSVGVLGNGPRPAMTGRLLGGLFLIGSGLATARGDHEVLGLGAALVGVAALSGHTAGATVAFSGLTLGGIAIAIEGNAVSGAAAIIGATTFAAAGFSENSPRLGNLTTNAALRHGLVLELGGAALLLAGAGALLRREHLAGRATIGIGLALVALGISVWLDSRRLRRLLDRVTYLVREPPDTPIPGPQEALNETDPGQGTPARGAP